MKRAVALLLIVLLGTLCLASAARDLSGAGTEVVTKVADITHAGEQLEAGSSRQLRTFFWYWRYYKGYPFYYGYFRGRLGYYGYNYPGYGRGYRYFGRSWAPSFWFKG